MMDTGAQISLITKSAVVRSSCREPVPEHLKLKGVCIRTFGNRIAAANETMVNVVIGSDVGTNIEVPCVVVEDSAMTCCMLLGNNVIRNLYGVLDFNTDACKFFDV